MRILTLKGHIVAALLCLIALTAVFFINGFEGDKPAVPVQVEVR